ncbi:MAG: hypothetical protein WAM05_18450, partial [Candidatus Binataceae bacterium]
SDIYVRYLADNRAVIAEIASDFFGRAIRAEIVAVNAAPATPASATASIAAAPRTNSGSGDTSIAEAAAPVTKVTANGATPSIPAAAATRRVSTSPEERAALFADPVVERVLETLEARFVEVRAAVAVAQIAATEVIGAYADSRDEIPDEITNDDAEPRD